MMGTFTYPITLHAASGDRIEVLDAMVDTGSTFNAFPAPVLEAPGVKSHRSVRLRLANG
jgi:predicted aspartyl protease